MASNARVLQEQILQEIDESRGQIYLDIRKKKLLREPYLEELEKRCEREGLEEEEAQEILELVDKMLWGFGILDDLIQDPDISDIRLISKDNIRIKKLGKRMGTDIQFADDASYNNYIEFITSRNETNMSVVNAIQVFTDKVSSKDYILRFTLSSPLVNSNDNAILLIRKIAKQKKTFDTLIKEGMLTRKQADYLVNRWREGHGFLICGPNGCGKTTITNAILEETPESRSGVIIQESEELFTTHHPEMIERKMIPPKKNSSVSYTLTDLARLALMESFDIIVIGEIKGDEAAELSYATYTGSQCMTTVHSISARAGYEKLIDYALDAQPNRTRGHFAKQLKNLDTVLYLKNYKLVEIVELSDFNKERGDFDFKEIVIEEEGE